MIDSILHVLIVPFAGISMFWYISAPVILLAIGYKVGKVY